MTTHSMSSFYRGKKVLVTGCTGFKGAWLCHTLQSFGATVSGISLAPYTDRDIFVVTNLKDTILYGEFDIRDTERVRQYIAAFAPDIVFHLAAQPLVRLSYDEPVLTMGTNILGTVNVLDAVRHTPSVKSVVIITTDKVYRNQEWVHGYRECDELGGYDPYSGSKAAADIVTQTYISSYFNPKEYGAKHETLVAIARAGNVIGGGDWSQDRLIPDIMRSVLHGDGVVTLRNPQSVRPWEHVLEPISGYLLLAKRLFGGDIDMSGAWNFGPDTTSWVSVGEVTEQILACLGKGTLSVVSDDAKHEAGLLTLDITKAQRLLGWRSQWSIAETVAKTAQWYRVVAGNHRDAAKVTQQQITQYFEKGC